VYILQAQSGQSRELQGHQTVTITDHDIDDAILTLGPALEIPLSVRIVDADPQQAQKIRSSLGRFTLTTSDGLNDNAMAQPRGDGTWLFHSIGPGAYRMGLRGPEGTYVKSIHFGNQDITTSFLDTTSGGGALEMALSPHAAEVTGVVQDANGQPLSGATVTLWMPGLPPYGTVDQARSTNTDATGHFRFGSLRPGEYRIAAWEEIEPGMGNIPEFHARFDDSATTVKLSEGSHETVEPVLISREKIDAEAARIQ
jgi:Carboxypeptidase regulatory-like domain